MRKPPTLQEVSKQLNVGSVLLFRYLRKQRIIGKDNLPFQCFIDCGYFTIFTGEYCNEIQGRVFRRTYRRTAVTPKGVEFLRENIAPKIAKPVKAAVSDDGEQPTKSATQTEYQKSCNIILHGSWRTNQKG